MYVGHKLSLYIGLKLFLCDSTNVIFCCTAYRLFSCDDSERMNVSIYDELAGHSAAVLGEIDSGADLIVAGLSKPCSPLLCSNT